VKPARNLVFDENLASCVLVFWEAAASFDYAQDAS
jgi:hypothetical protein